jgi:predicted nucleotidyltransferase
MTEMIAGVTGGQLWEVARRHGVLRLRVFGSWARGDAGPDSDLDLLVNVEPGTSLLDMIGLQQDLEDLVGGKVDVLTEDGISPYVKERILAEARPL